MEPSWDGGTTGCSNGPGRMTKMAAMPIYGKNIKKILSGTKRLITLKVDMQHRILEYYQVCSNADPGLTLTYFTARSNFVPYAFILEEGKTIDFFRNYYSLWYRFFFQKLVVCGIEVGR